MKKPLQTDKKLTSLDDMFGKGEDVGNRKVQEIDVEKLIPFENHPFRLYMGAKG